MVPAPLTLLKVNGKFFFPDSMQFREPKLGVTPKAFYTVNMVFASGKFIFMVMDAVVLVAVGHQPIISLPAIGIDLALFQDIAFQDRHQRLFGAIVHDTEIDCSPALVQAKDRSLSTGSAPPFPSHPPGAEVTFIHLNFSGKNTDLRKSQIKDSVTPKRIKTMDSPVVHGGQISRNKRRNIRRKQSQNLPIFWLDNPRSFFVSVFHCSCKLGSCFDLLQLHKPHGFCTLLPKGIAYSEKNIPMELLV